ncbi:MAG: ABC-F family ATP-binding cassette domain-containing protein [Alphaproteobacteria bacterium]
MSKEVHLSLNNAHFFIGKTKLLNDVSISIHKNDKIALVGKNGVGKSTLLKILSGKISIDEGEFWINPKIKIGMLNQKNEFSDDNSVEKYLLKENKDDNNSNKFEIDRITKELKLDKNKIVNQLSGGEKRKLGLSQLLLSSPDLLLLDEPTNHLDIESILWLENFLNNEFKGSSLIISHDRSFLKKTTNRVFWMDRRAIKVSSKGFFNFEIWKTEQIEQEKRELKNKKKFLEEELSWLNKGVKARRKRNIKRKDNIDSLKVDFKKQNSEFVRSISHIKIHSDSASSLNGPNVLINFINVNKIFEKEKNIISIIRDFNYKLMKGERIGILGRNGVGKSTFLNLASNKVKPTKGSIKIKKKIEFSFFDQTGQQFSNEKTIKKNMIPNGGDYIEVVDKKIHICGYLKNFLFDPKDINRPVSTLSGGERNRLLLAKILANPREILILDEPTNDLDTETIDMLIEFLKSHQGASMISSHDIDFLSQTCHKFFIFEGDGIVNLSNSPLLKTKKIEKYEFNNSIPKKGKPVSNNKLIEKLLRKIERKESDIRKMTDDLQNANSNYLKSKEYKELLENLKSAQSDLDFLENEWLELEEKSISHE